MRGTTTTDLTDRDRLAAAFDTLRQRGYLAPIEWAWEMPAPSWGFLAADEQRADKVVFWHVQKDDAAFFADPYGDDWFEPADDPTPEQEAAELAWRLDHATLVRSLWLHWRGHSADAFEIVEVLCDHGLDAWWDGDEGDCIAVRPREAA